MAVPGRPMAPARSSTRHPHIGQNNNLNNDHDHDIHVNPTLFLDPMLGTPLAMYIEKDVHDKDILADLISKYGGTVSQGYSGVTYILVDPYKSSGQNLWRQYVGKKTKIVLDAQWVHECIKTGELQTFQTNWAGCKVTGKESASGTPEIQSLAPSSNRGSTPRRRTGNSADPTSNHENNPRHIALPPPAPTLQHPIQTQGITPMTVNSIADVHHNGYSYPVYPASMHTGQRPLQPAPAPPQTWQQSVGIAPQQTHLAPPPIPSHLLHRPHDGWNGYEHPAHPPDPMVGPSSLQYDYRYREEPPAWVGGPDYYGSYDQTYAVPPSMEETPQNPVASPSPEEQNEQNEKRGRKRARAQPTPAPSAASLVLNKNPPARSPSPPSRVIKSTYGGNLFTSDDVLYLKRYIDYCQEQGLVLSLREICERIAVKAPHHTFYSWRRYCNKHQIRLGGYIMNLDRGESPTDMDDDQDIEEEPNISLPPLGPTPPVIPPQIDPNLPRDRSPTPPRALFRSTTGKGVAFTNADVTFLVRFMEYRKSQGRLDMVTFWKEVATKAPHHSRASWMKYWRRHKHEFAREDDDDPLPERPEKKMRYSKEDDILLAKYFFEKPEGTSDKVFQAFGRSYPHHPWKGWQEHHRIHKAKIDHFMQMLGRGESLDGEVTLSVQQ